MKNAKWVMGAQLLYVYSSIFNHLLRQAKCILVNQFTEEDKPRSVNYPQLSQGASPLIIRLRLSVGGVLGMSTDAPALDI